MSIFYDLVGKNELEDAFTIESQGLQKTYYPLFDLNSNLVGYPEDEAGSLETFQ